MRNWNRDRLSQKAQLSQEFSAYLWGIETCATFLYPPGASCFQRTYEELKHVIIGESDAGKSGFQRTYEELKRKSHRKSKQPVFSFQRTYEELKHMVLLVSFLLPLVFSVPMRNWNRSITENTAWPFRRFQRTYEELKPIKAGWGMSLPPGFQRTYEELKRVSEGWNGGGRQDVFSVPMRNWNFLCSLSHSNACLVFSVPMRNWNYVRRK